MRPIGFARSMKPTYRRQGELGMPVGTTGARRTAPEVNPGDETGGAGMGSFRRSSIGSSKRFPAKLDPHRPSNKSALLRAVFLTSTRPKR